MADKKAPPKDWQEGYQQAQAIDAELQHWQEFLQNIVKVRTDLRAKATEAYSTLQPIQSQKDALEKIVRQTQAESERVQTELANVKHRVNQDIKALQSKGEKAKQDMGAELARAEAAHKDRMDAISLEYSEAKSRHKEAMAALDKALADAKAKHDQAMQEFKEEERDVRKRIEGGQDQLRQLRAIIDKGTR